MKDNKNYIVGIDPYDTTKKSKSNYKVRHDGPQQKHPNFLHYVTHNRQKRTWMIITHVLGIGGAIYAFPIGLVMLFVPAVMWYGSWKNWTEEWI
jgi:hypothetical protein